MDELSARELESSNKENKIIENEKSKKSNHKKAKKRKENNNNKTRQQSMLGMVDKIFKLFQICDCSKAQTRTQVSSYDLAHTQKHEIATFTLSNVLTKANKQTNK